MHLNHSCEFYSKVCLENNQKYALLLHERRSPDSYFSTLPLDVINYILKKYLQTDLIFPSEIEPEIEKCQTTVINPFVVDVKVKNSMHRDLYRDIKVLSEYIFSSYLPDGNQTLREWHANMNKNNFKEENKEKIRWLKKFKLKKTLQPSETLVNFRNMITNINLYPEFFQSKKNLFQKFQAIHVSKPFFMAEIGILNTFDAYFQPKESYSDVKEVIHNLQLLCKIANRLHLLSDAIHKNFVQH